MKWKIFKTSSFVFLLIVIGKLFSMIREMYFSAIFGTSIYADAYFTANIIPSLLNAPLTISSLVFFIPLYTGCKEKKGEEAANRFASNLITIYVIFNTFLALVAFVAGPAIVKILAPEFTDETYRCCLSLVRLLVLSFPVTIAVHIYMNISNANQKHYVPQLLTLFNSIISIILMFLLIPTYGIYAMPVIGLIAWLLQLVIQSFSIRKEFRYQFVLDLKDPLVKTLILLAIPVIIGTAADQINLSVDNILASSLGSGSVSAMNYAQKLFNLLNGTITTAILTVSYPICSRLYAAKKTGDLTNFVNRYFNIIMLIMLPVMILCIGFSDVAVQLFFARGAFEMDSVFTVANVFSMYAIAILFSAIKEFVTKIYYIYENSKTPMIINAISILINVVLSIVFTHYFGLPGIAIGTSIATMFACIIEIIVFRKKYAEERKLGIFSLNQVWKYLVASLAMAFLMIVLNFLLSDLFYLTRTVIVAVLSFIVYVLFLTLLKERNCVTAANMIKQKVFRVDLH